MEVWEGERFARLSILCVHGLELGSCETIWEEENREKDMVEIGENVAAITVFSRFPSPEGELQASSC